MSKTSNIKRFDPLNIDGRLYEQVSKLLDQLQEEGVTLRERYMSLAAIARIRIAYVRLAENRDNPDAGATVRKYTTAFASNAVSGRAGVRRRPAVARITPAAAAADEAADAEWDREFDDESA
jgi:hypothetical protein